MANDRYEDPQYGTFVGIDEASSLSLIPKGTLRLWRREGYTHLARFRFTTIDKKVWYPLSDIQRYQKENGIDPEGKRGAPIFDEGKFTHLPPLPAVEIEPKTHEAIIKAKRITRTNWEKIRNEITKPFDNPTMMILAAKKKWGEELTEFWFKDDLEAWRPLVHHYPNDPNFPQYGVAPAPEDVTRTNFILVQLTRLMDAEIAGRQLTVADVVTLPVD